MAAGCCSYSCFLNSPRCSHELPPPPDGITAISFEAVFRVPPPPVFPDLLQDPLSEPLQHLVAAPPYSAGLFRIVLGGDYTCLSPAALSTLQCPAQGHLRSLFNDLVNKGWNIGALRIEWWLQRVAGKTSINSGVYFSQHHWSPVSGSSQASSTVAQTRESYFSRATSTWAPSGEAL